MLFQWAHNIKAMATILSCAFDLILSTFLKTIFTGLLIHPGVKSSDVAINACWGKVREEYSSKSVVRDSQVWGISSCK